MIKELILEKNSLPVGWELKNLLEVSNVLTGKHNANHSKKDGKYRFYTCAYEHLFCDTKKFKGECLIFPGNGANVGEVFYFDGEFDAYQRTYVIFDIKINAMYLHYHMLLYWRELGTKLQYGSATNFIKIGNFQDYEVSVPPKNQQKQIVAILDKAFAVIDTAKANAEQNLLNAKELFESYLQNVFENKGDDWEEKTLKQISDDFGRGKSKHRPRNDKKLYGGNYPFIQTGDIRNSEHFITDYSQTYNEIGLAQSKLWPKGTICITIAANIAETGILSFDACFPDSVIGIVVDNKQAEIDYVEYLLQYFKVNIQSLSQGSAQENINLGTFEGKLFPFALLEEQKKIVDKLDALSSECKKLEAIYTQKIADLEEMKKSILQKAFSGQLNTIN
jgi:type I restriction enzyme S subunit